MEPVDLAERLRQFEVVCRVAIHVRGSGYNNHHRGSKGDCLEIIAAREFDLSRKHTQYCLARARNFIFEAREMERIRNKNKGVHDVHVA